MKILASCRKCGRKPRRKKMGVSPVYWYGCKCGNNGSDNLDPSGARWSWNIKNGVRP
jgi:hypothetical protein